MLEYLAGNKRYLKYFEHDLYTSKLNLMELYFLVMRESGEDVADEAYTTFRVLLDLHYRTLSYVHLLSQRYRNGHLSLSFNSYFVQLLPSMTTAGYY